MLRFLCAFLLGLFLAFPGAGAAADPLPLPDSIRFTDIAKLPQGINERTLSCAIISDDANILVIETSTRPGVQARFSIDKGLLAEINRADPSIRPFAELPLDLPPESMPVNFYHDKIDRLFRPFLKKFPSAPGAAAVQAAEKAHQEEMERVSKGEFRVGGRWTLKSLLSETDLKAIALLQKARSEAAFMSTEDFKKFVDECRTCFASEFFALLGKTVHKVHAGRLEKLKKEGIGPEELEKRVKEEQATIVPLNGWNWGDVEKGSALVWQAEDMLKANPPEDVAIPLNLLIQSENLAPFLLGRQRVLREQSQRYADQAAADGAEGRRAKSLAWYHAAFLLAGRLPAPENQKTTEDILLSVEKTFNRQVGVAVEQRNYDEARAWYKDMMGLLEKTPAAASKLPGLKKSVGDFEKFLKAQINQQTIDNLRKTISELMASGDFNKTRIELSTHWDKILAIEPSEEETKVFAHAALDQAEAAFRAWQPVSGYHLMMLAQRIAPEDPRVKSWMFGAFMAALGAVIFLLLPFLWLVAKSTNIIENIRYRLRLRGLRKKNPKRGPDPGGKRR